MAENEQRSAIERKASLSASAAVFAPATDAATARSIWIAKSDTWADIAPDVTPAQRQWLAAQSFNASARKTVLVPGIDGSIAGAVFGAAPPRTTSLVVRHDRMAAPEVLVGGLPSSLPAGTYKFATPPANAELAAIAWGLGGYRDRRYKSSNGGEPQPRLVIPDGADDIRVRGIVDGVCFGRDLINMPSNDLGPAELEAAVRQLAAIHSATVASTIGDELLKQKLNLIHAVGRASPRAPRLIDLRWGNDGPLITLVGKGICFDTGGLDLKPSAGMLLMKKDMGGAAAVLALAHMVMTAKLKVRLRVLISAAENAVAGNAFRPGDVITSRAGLTVEIGNTDAEGRLVLADALSLADDETPDLIATFSTLTGAARTALGPELPPYYTDDDALAVGLDAACRAVADPVWRLPIWNSYEPMLDSSVADINNVSEGPFAGSIIAALFLRKFVKQAPRFLHLDIFGWRPAAKPLGPRGGEVQGARALFQLLSTGLPKQIS
jgi:leucyl aminopeptidase